MIGYLPFTAMAEELDKPAVEACLNCGMIVIVATDNGVHISEIIGAYTSVVEAYNVFHPLMWDGKHAVIMQVENGAAMYYQPMLQCEFKAAAKA